MLSNIKPKFKIFRVIDGWLFCHPNPEFYSPMRYQDKSSGISYAIVSMAKDTEKKPE